LAFKNKQIIDFFLNDSKCKSRSNLNKKKYGDKNPKWRPKIKMASNGHFLSNKRLERHLSGKLLTNFGWNSLNIYQQNTLSYSNTIAEIQDGVKIQNGGKNKKKLIFAAKWSIFNGFPITFLCFVRPTSVYKTPLSWNI
jgi:hypothetical protein